MVICLAANEIKRQGREAKVKMRADFAVPQKCCFAGFYLDHILHG